MREILKGALSVALRAAGRPKLAVLRRRRGLRLHLGCGGDRLEGFLNVDSRATRATDLVTDLTLPRFAPGSVSFAYSNAFFEHLYRDSRVPHLRRIRESLDDGGAACYIGIPYFRNVARYYLERGPGTAAPVFDLYNVYRYTHGDPEHAHGWWLGQLHKSLFDEDELAELLERAGFASYVLFCYGYPGDVNELPVTMGFYATRTARGDDQMRRECTGFLRERAQEKVRLATMEWLGTRGPAPSRLGS